VRTTPPCGFCRNVNGTGIGNQAQKIGNRNRIGSGGDHLMAMS
jgi:hypothetical protein